MKILRPDVQRRAANILAHVGARIDAVDAHFARTRGWIPNYESRAWHRPEFKAAGYGKEGIKPPQSPPITGREIKMAGNTYRGLAPDTDPLYDNAWKIMLEQNLSPSFVKQLSEAGRQEAKAKPRQPAKAAPRQKK